MTTTARIEQSNAHAAVAHLPDGRWVRAGRIATTTTVIVDAYEPFHRDASTASGHSHSTTMNGAGRIGSRTLPQWINDEHPYVPGAENKERWAACREHRSTANRDAIAAIGEAFPGLLHLAIRVGDADVTTDVATFEFVTGITLG